MNIREKITAWEPGAVWSEAGDGWRNSTPWLHA